MIFLKTIIYNCKNIIWMLNHFMPRVSFDIAWKQQKTKGFPEPFQGVSKETSDMKWVK